ncbi:C4-dicarboxylate ABC transporter substrate-binding protein [Rhodosalinus sediminis]|uniref:C4-dicarboxylate ABC transporter substrate-binding protein n=1 Tax=Rhodosalinus sediminis TaxID=1940533 RepID=A0A3D9BXZ0_9RHOB|nr:TRAP transporter substrate-binding protein DctP [Rhodosalinus sediminis]REC58430.1 C4-dicarboxylate ABC transporter substrate-binding protein [Rhodosalinus sediminis]
MTLTIRAGLIAGSALAAAPAAAEDVLSAVHAFPETLVYTQSFLDFVDKVNEAGEGVVRIEVRGGPEAIGMFQQPEAVRNGVVDMVYTPGSFYAGALPEKDALVAANVTAAEARAAGGLDLIDEIHQEKMGVKYLGWFDSGVSYNLWTVDEPMLDAEGNLDVSDWKLRGNPVYNAFFTEYLGASVIDIPTTDVYSALERGIVDATGWTQIGLLDLKWDDFVNYRIEPDFFSTDLGVIVNLDTWEGLSEEARAILTETALEHERTSAEALAELRDEEFAELEAGGMQVVTLEGEAAQNYLDAAREKTWERMRTQMEKHPMGLEHYDALIEAFYDPSKDPGS